jgi:hypothetical protein
MLKSTALSWLIVLLGNVALAQVATYPLERNASLEAFHHANPDYVFQPTAKYKFGTRDTLSLPFFDDFSTSTLYPDSSKWLNNQVYVNNQFPIFPPTLNVATFDVLNAQGLPYNNTINKDFIGAGDSLISQPVNLEEEAGTPYTVADSLILSFYYQPNGNGYHLNAEDKIMLWFKAANGLWFSVWSKTGVPESQDFEQVLVPILDPNYLHKGFQFMFTTHTRQVANANHWHIDYVLLDKDRDRAVQTHDDYAIQSTPTSLLQTYWAMPYEHFSTSPSTFMADSVKFWISNLAGVDKRLQVRHEAFANGVQRANTLFAANSNNHLAEGKKQRNLAAYDISNIANTGEVEVKRLVEVTEQGIPNDIRVNDTIQFTQTLHDYYAYDDGSAERGFGFDQNTNPSNIEGEIAYGFDVVKSDTLYAIATYFNQAVFDVSRNKFKYRIWKELSGVNGGEGDSIIYESEEMTPTYSIANGVRTFTPFPLDTTLVLSPGKYYIGWWQGSMFNLNVGWDMNYGNTQNPQRKNPNLFAKIFGQWSNDVPDGTLMMRPHFGSSGELYAGVFDFEKSFATPLVYPNPAKTVVNFGKTFDDVRLLNMQGQEVLFAQNVSSLNVAEVQSGTYFIKLTNNAGEQFTSRISIIAP